MVRDKIEDEKQHISFVLVHLGKKPIPDYVWDCIRQIRLFNDNPIYLIVNIYNIGINLPKVLRYKVRLVYAETLIPSSVHKKYQKNTSNKWFWRFTTERFFFVSELMQKRGLCNVLHLENDNLIYCRVDDYLEQFQNLNGDQMIGVTRDSNHRCIGGIVYIPAKEALDGYLAFVAENPELNDMQSLSDYLETQQCSYLPVVYDEYESTHEMTNQLGQSLEEKYHFSACSKSFGAVFDAAALGQYIGGIDKIHNSGDSRGFINETACYNPKLMGCEWRIIEGKKVPVIQGEDYFYRVFNLHMHCKELYKYLSKE